MTAGNSTPLTDGASVGAARLGGVGRGARPARCWPTSPTYETAAVDYVHGGEGLLMAPAYAVPRMLAARRACRSRTSTSTRSTRRSPRRCSRRSRRGRTRCSARSASASTRRSARSTATKLNVNGSSLAAGHPFAATGGRIVNTLAQLLAEKGSGRGLISICAAGGQGVVAILER